MRAAARVPAKISDVQNLFSSIKPCRTDSWRHEVELVDVSEGIAMSMTDPVADMLTRIRNALGRGYPVVDVPSSKLKREIATVLQKEGFILSADPVEGAPHPTFRIRLRYLGEGRSVIHGIKRMSKPGKRVYIGHREVPSVMGGIGIAILSTPKGVMTGQRSRRERVGGEMLCTVW